MFCLHYNIIDFYINSMERQITNLFRTCLGNKKIMKVSRAFRATGVCTAGGEEELRKL